MEEQKEVGSDITLKVFPKPPEERVKAYEGKKKLNLTIAFGIGALVCFVIFLFSLVAIILVSNYSFFNILALIMLIGITGFLGLKTKKSIEKKIECITAKIKYLKNVTATYESIKPEDRGLKIKLNVYYEFQDSKKRIFESNFSILFNKDELEELRSEIPEVGNEIFIIFDTKNSKELEVYIPKLKPYMDSLVATALKKN